MKRIRVARLLILVALSIGATGVARAADTPVQFKDIKVADLPEGVTVMLETSGPARYQATLIDSPTRLVIDMSGTYAAPKTRWTPTPEPIREIRGSQWKVGTARLVVELSRQVAYRIKESPTGLSVVIEPARRGRVETATLEAPQLPDAKPEAPRPNLSRPDAQAPTALKPDESKLVDPKPSMATVATEIQRAAAPLPAAPTRVVQAAPSPIMLAQTTAPAQARPQTAPDGSKLITLDFKDADVVNVLRILSAEGGRNIVLGDDVKGKVTVTLRNVTWEQALDTILEARGLQRIEKGGVIRIVSSEQLIKEREAQARAEEAKRKGEIDVRTKMAEAQLKEAELAAKKAATEAAAAEAAARGPLVEEVLRLSYADPEEVAKTLQGILGIPPEGTAPVQSAPIGVPATPTVVPSGGGVPNPALGQLPTLNTPTQPAPWAPQQFVSVSQDVLAKGITIKANKATNSIFLRLYRSDMERIKKLVHEHLDVPLPQVKIEARMEILERTALESIGIQWGVGGGGSVGKATLLGQGFAQPNPGGGTGAVNVNPSNPNLNLSSLLPISPSTGLPIGGNLINLPLSALPHSGGVIPAGGLAFGIVGTNFNVNLALQALSTLGKTRTLARPEIVTIENSKAAISLGEEIPYATVSSAGTQIQFKEALLKLEVTPTVIRDKHDGQDRTQIKMIVVIENNSRGETVNLGQSGSPPAINRRKAETLVLMHEGERLVIGGVTTSANSNTVHKVPLFGDIPVVGWLFKQREIFEEGRELVVFLTPSVLKPSVAGAAPAR
jgi:type IV pilus secretin PilQ/predicted competence protein